MLLERALHRWVDTLELVLHRLVGSPRTALALLALPKCRRAGDTQNKKTKMFFFTGAASPTQPA
jgi:hypothetical protein